MQVVLVQQSVAAPLDDADLVVQPFDQAERDLVLRPAVGRDPVPVPLDRLGELLEGLKPLPAQRGTPLIEELAGPSFAAVLPELG